MKSIFTAITTFFEADDWPIHQLPNQPVYSMTFVGDSGQWTCVAQAIEEDRRFIFYSTFPVDIPQMCRLPVCEFIAEVNYNLILGNFEMSLTDGDLRYRTSISVPNHDLGAFLIHQLVYTNVTMMDKYMPAIFQIINEEITVQEALQVI